jgi:hypothetical protein
VDAAEADGKPTGKHDLRAGAFPAGALEDWGDPDATLAALYRYVEDRATDAADWYLRDKRGKKRWSRALRVLAIVLAAAGGIQPLVDAATPGSGPAEWGYVLLALAAACVGFDRFFGLSSGWMRDIRAAQAVQRRLEAFRFEWAAAALRDAGQPAGPERVRRSLALIRRFEQDVAGVVERETNDWVLEFQSGLAQLEHHTGHQPMATPAAPQPALGESGWLLQASPDAEDAALEAEQPKPI